MNWVCKLTMAVALSIAAVAPARAAVIFDFIQFGPTMGTEYGTGNPRVSSARFNGRLVVSDEEYASGFRFAHSDLEWPLPGATDEQLAALPNILFVLSDNFRTRVIDNDFMFGPHPTNVASNYRFSAAPGGNLEGSASIRGGGDQFSLTLPGDGTFTLRFGGDYRLDLGGCINAPCTLQGQVTTTRVPEPASLALFGVGMAGLGLVRRRRV